MKNGGGRKLARGRGEGLLQGINKKRRRLTHSSITRRWDEDRVKKGVTRRKKKGKHPDFFNIQRLGMGRKQ